jgi:glycosyltransferase involved in cell wall biosynthesis
MRIGIDVQSTLGQKTGIGLYTASLLHALRRVAPHHEYIELAWGRSQELRTDQRLYWQQWVLPRQASRTRVDVLHVPGFDAPFVKPCPVVLTVHDLIGCIFPHNLPPVSRFYWNYWLPRSVRWADVVIADSHHTKNDLLRLIDIPADRIHVVYLGVDSAFQPLQDSPALEAVRLKYNLPPEFILYVGTIEPRKGLDTLLVAYAMLADEIPHSLVIAGKRGWYTRSLFQLVENHRLGQRVHFTGYIADHDLPQLYNLAALFVYPSRYEGFGLPPLEAMACGVPVVCSDASSLPEVVGDAAWLVPPDAPDMLATAIRQVLENHQLQAVMRSRGLERAGCFTWEETARKVAEIYEGLG